MASSTLVKSEHSGGGAIEKASGVYSALRRNRPRTKKDVKNYVKVFLGIDIPDKKIDAGLPLKTLQWIDLSQGWNEGIKKIVERIKGQCVDW